VRVVVGLGFDGREKESFALFSPWRAGRDPSGVEEVWSDRLGRRGSAEVIEDA